MEISLEEYGKLSDRITDLMHENERLRKIVLATQSWISVKDRLPDSDRGERWVLTWDGSGQYGIEAWSETYRKWTDDEYRIKEKVSYWMPLPEPPEEEKDEY